MTSEVVNALADYLEAVHRDWQRHNGYTGRPVHRRAYWVNMAARLLTDGTAALGRPKPKP